MTLYEICLGTWGGHTASFEAVGAVITVIIRIDDLDIWGVFGRITNDGIRFGSGRAGCLHPAIDGSTAIISHTTAGKRTCYASVVYRSAQVAEERLVESAYSMSVTVEVSGKASFISARLLPSCIFLRRYIAAQDEIQIGSVRDSFIERIRFRSRSLSCIGFHVQVIKEVEVVLFLLSSSYAVGFIISSIQINLAGTVDILVVNEHTFGMVHHLAHAVVVGHGEGYGVGVCLAQIGLGIVGHIVVVLIPVHGGGIVFIFYAILMLVSIFGGFEDFPSTTEDFVGTSLDRGYRQTHHRVRQYCSRRCHITNCRLSATEFQVDVDDMLFTVMRNICTFTLLIVVAIHHRNDAILTQVVDV